jgi:aryl-alcohol dehydrogenase-like predicted oxidoreductase
MRSEGRVSTTGQAYPVASRRRYGSGVRVGKLGTLEISVVGLGCITFGRTVDEKGTRAVVDTAIDSGVSFFDTADVYGDGASETLLGRALAGRRDRVVLATKWGLRPMWADPEPHGSRAYIRRAIEGSLTRLQTDHVDLYQHHHEDAETSLEETFAALKELHDEGKILAAGTSNYSASRVAKAAAIAAELGLPCVSEQSEYSWVCREVENDLLPICERLGLGFIAHSPLAAGLLTGKITRDTPPAEGTRLHGHEIADADLDHVERLRKWAKARGVSLLEVALGGLASVPQVVSVIPGAKTPQQVRENAAAAEWRPSADELAELRQL